MCWDRPWRMHLAQSSGIDMRALIAEALHMGDEGHNRNKAGSLLYLKLISPLIAKVVKDDAVEAGDSPVHRRQRA